MAICALCRGIHFQTRDFCHLVAQDCCTSVRSRLQKAGLQLPSAYVAPTLETDYRA